MIIAMTVVITIIILLLLIILVMNNDINSNGNFKKNSSPLTEEMLFKAMLKSI